MTQGETETDILRNAGGTVSGVQAGAVLGIGRSTTLRMLKDGTFPTPVLRLGRQYRVPVASLRKLLDLPAEPRIDAERVAG